MHLAIDVDSDFVRASILDEDGIPRVLPLGESSDGMPAVVRRTMHGWSVGSNAERFRFGNSETTVTGCVRLLQRTGAVTAKELARLPFPVRVEGNELLCDLLYAEARATEICGELLRETVRVAEEITHIQVKDVVLTVPASADDRVRVRVRCAAEQCGLRVRRLINQPTAALLAAELPDATGQVLVVHIGGASIDVTVADVNHLHGARHIRVLSTQGYSESGIETWTWLIAERVAERIRRLSGFSLHDADSSGAAMQGLVHAVREAMGALSIHESTQIFLDHGGGFGRDIVHDLHRAEVESWLQQEIDDLVATCHRAWKRVRTTSRWHGPILLTGGMGNWRQLHRALAALCDGPLMAAPPHLPALGAALAISEEASIWDVTPYPLGIASYMNDVEQFSRILPANTPIPTPSIGQVGAASQPFTTRFPDQTSVCLTVLQYRGERENARILPDECDTLGTWQFENLQPPPGGRADFTVAFAVDRDGILHLQAVESATGHQLQATVDREIG